MGLRRGFCILPLDPDDAEGCPFLIAIIVTDMNRVAIALVNNAGIIPLAALPSCENPGTYGDVEDGNLLFRDPGRIAIVVGDLATSIFRREHHAWIEEMIIRPLGQYAIADVHRRWPILRP